MSIDIEAIRARHVADAWATMADFTGYATYLDRGALLAEVDRLQAESARLRAQITEAAWVVQTDDQWDVRIHGAALARTTLGRLLGVKDAAVRSDG